MPCGLLFVLCCCPRPGQPQINNIKKQNTNTVNNIHNALSAIGLLRKTPHIISHFLLFVLFSAPSSSSSLSVSFHPMLSVPLVNSLANCTSAVVLGISQIFVARSADLLGLLVSNVCESSSALVCWITVSAAESGPLLLLPQS